MIVLPSCQHPPQPSSSTFHHAEVVAKAAAPHPANQSNQSNPEFEPVRTHRIISAATAASVRSPYRRPDDTAVSFVRLRVRPSQSATPLSSTDGNNNQYHRWKRSLPPSLSSPRQSQRKQSKRSNVTNNNNNNNDRNRNDSINRHLSAKHISDNNDSSNHLRYTSRVIISDDFSQVDIKSDDNEVEPVSREGEWIDFYTS